MDSRENLLKRSEYWCVKLECDIYQHIYSYQKKHNLSNDELAKKLDVSKYFISQLLKCEANYKIDKLVDISLKLGLVPIIKFEPIDKVIEKDKKKH